MTAKVRAEGAATPSDALENSSLNEQLASLGAQLDAAAAAGDLAAYRATWPKWLTARAAAPQEHIAAADAERLARAASWQTSRRLDGLVEGAA